MDDDGKYEILKKKSLYRSNKLTCLLSIFIDSCVTVYFRNFILGGHLLPISDNNMHIYMWQGQINSSRSDNIT